MRQLSIDIAEYESFEELLEDFFTMPPNMKPKGGVALSQSKKEAKEQLERYPHIRRFYWKKKEGYYILYELLND
jgi:hypothetical protein